MISIARDIDGTSISPGDVVISCTDDHTTARRGRKLKVEEVYWTSKGWRFKTNHPYPKFGMTSYYLSKFRLIARGQDIGRWFNSLTVTHVAPVDGFSKTEQEKTLMYIAIDAGRNDPAVLCPTHIREATFVAMDTSMDRGFKTQVEAYIKNKPEAVVMVFSLDKLVEAERQPIIWRNMK